MSSLPCSLSGRCGGCPWIADPLPDQRQKKLQGLRDAAAAAGVTLPEELAVVDLGPGGLRDRADLSLGEHDGAPVIGLRALNDSDTLIDMAACPMMSPALEAWLQDFRQNLPALARGGARLRVSPTGDRGVWLDLPNEQIHSLMVDGRWLRGLMAQAQVELGQRRKPLEDRLGALHLHRQPHLAPWTRTFLGDDERPQALYGAVGDFSQPGDAGNRALVRTVRQAAAQVSAQDWLELGAGAGNFTLPLAATGAAVKALELEVRAVAGLRQAAEEAGLIDRIDPIAASWESPRAADAIRGAEALLVDPPRSGLGRFAQRLADAKDGPGALLYVSCAAESFITDLGTLAPAGWRVRSLTLVDQLPQTPHGEWVALVTR